MAFDASLYFRLVSNLTSPLDLSTAASVLDKSAQIPLTQGSGAGQADKVWHDTRTITASATDTLDLAGGGLTDPFGAAFTLARIKGLLVVAAGGNTNNVNVQRPATNGVPLFSAVSSNIAVHPGGVFLWMAPSAAGVVVTAGTGDLIDFVNSSGGTPVTYDVVIIGASS
ncbi:hypothetical protein Ssi03_62700 [Sphaerisporangium siamense]|uniref:Uncharacterized protein n=1 Tax=Sphaerisporangium siamense TaxID=795645 RepID=A0A7W7G990_9ACTN|nr:hypothetical protein [Sphaerisporangium siamense]MBB4702578.1 hypothetical protein [Sphaerisporangium siamense]GII88280.1 hypothetical protein Ssi03_62700 [Sphaerisporangium siamense]